MTSPPRTSPPQTSHSNSFPVPPVSADAASGVGVAPSVISSQMSDIVQDADGTPRNTTVPGLTGPTGEPGLPPPRPSSLSTGTSGNRRSQMDPPSSRRGMLPSQTGPRPLSTSGTSSRPISSASRTHIPSLTSHAFYRPMSSQKLQAQRGQHPPPVQNESVVRQDQQRNIAANAGNRQSFGSFTTDNALGLHSENGEPLPPSRDTENHEVDPPDWSTMPSVPTAATIASGGESDAPLRSPSNKTPDQLKLQSSARDYATMHQPAQKSPRSFSSSFILQNMNGASGARRPQGHAKLDSVSSFPTTSQKQETSSGKKNLGKNWEYFTGNTVFCWGGRLQNSRDRPVNIFTGILALLPAGLFFGYS